MKVWTLARRLLLGGLLAVLAVSQAGFALAASNDGGGTGNQGRWVDEDTIDYGDERYITANEDNTIFIRVQNLARNSISGDPLGCVEEDNNYGGNYRITDISSDKKEAKFRIYIHALGECLPKPGSVENIQLANTEQADKKGGGGDVDAFETDCAEQSGGFGWIICPSIRLINDAITNTFNALVKPLLKVSPLDRADAGVEQTYKVWAAFRNMANVGFVLVFLVIVFANTLSIKIDSYAIKKMLPRLVAAAILVQFSFLLSGLIIDIGNVLGTGIAQLINGVLNTSPGSADTSSSAVQELISGFLIFGTGGIVLAGAVILFPITLLMFLLGLALGFLALVLTLVVRQIAISVLVVLAPIAFVLWVLPNTENFFKSWVQNMLRLSLMYPIIMLLLGAGRIVEAAASGGNSQGSLKQTIALLAPAITFFMIPLTIKAAGSLLAAGGGFLMGKAGAGKKRLNETGAVKRLKEEQSRRNWNRAAGLTGTGGEQKPTTGFGKARKKTMTALGRIGTGNVMPGARGQAAIARGFGQNVRTEGREVLDPLNLSPDVLSAIAQGNEAADAFKGDNAKYRYLAKSPSMQAAAGYQLAKIKDVKNLDKARQALSENVRLGKMTSGQADLMWGAMTSDNFGNLLEKDQLMAKTGWNDKNYTPAKARMVSREIAGKALSTQTADALQRLRTTTGGANHLSASAIDSATSGANAGNTTPDVRGAIWQLGMESQAEGAKFETLAKFQNVQPLYKTVKDAHGQPVPDAHGNATLELDASGQPIQDGYAADLRTTDEVKAIKAAYATDANYRQAVDRVIQSGGTSLPPLPPPSGGQQGRGPQGGGPATGGGQPPTPPQTPPSPPPPSPAPGTIVTPASSAPPPPPPTPPQAPPPPPPPGRQYFFRDRYNQPVPVSHEVARQQAASGEQLYDQSGNPIRYGE